MNWFKANPFLGGLALFTAVAAGVLYTVGGRTLAYTLCAVIMVLLAVGAYVLVGPEYRNRQALHLDDAVAAAGDCGATMAAGSAHSAPPRVQRAAEWWRPLGVDTAEVGRVRDALLLQYEAEHGTAEARGATVPT